MRSLIGIMALGVVIAWFVLGTKAFDFLNSDIIQLAIKR